MIELCEWQDLGVKYWWSHNTMRSLSARFLAQKNKKIIGDDNRHDLARSIGGKQQPSLAEVKTGAFPHKIQEDSIL